MPEGHSVHRIARQFARNFVGRPVAASSPQGRFAEGAALLDGRTVESVQAVGKQMFLETEGDLWLRVHLGLYGAWDFSGEILIDPTIASANGRMGQTNQRGTDLAGTDLAGAILADTPILDSAGENSLASIGAPRKTRVHVRMSEATRGLADEGLQWPPPVVGQVRLRLLTDATCADLRGPTACVLQTPDEMLATVARARAGSARRRPRRRRGALRRRGAQEEHARSRCCSWTRPWSAGSETCIARRCCSGRG